MRKEVSWLEVADRTLTILAKGAFLTTAAGGKLNSMTIGWGSIGNVWQKPVFMVMVRASRCTYQLLEASKEFTVSLPTIDFRKALGFCGSKSGRDLDKIADAGLVILPSLQIATPIISCPGLHYECRVVDQYDMTDAHLDPGIQTQSYADGDYHTIYFGQIMALYEIEA